jgi:hypothetical protein
MDKNKVMVVSSSVHHINTNNILDDCAGYPEGCIYLSFNACNVTSGSAEGYEG